MKGKFDKIIEMMFVGLLVSIVGLVLFLIFNVEMAIGWFLSAFAFHLIWLLILCNMDFTDEKGES